MSDLDTVLAPNPVGAQKTFGEWLTRRRKALDLTRDELSDLVNCAATTLRKIETGERRPSKELAGRLAAALRLPDGEHDRFLDFARKRDDELPPLPPRNVLRFEDASSRETNGRDELPVSGGALVGRRQELEECASLLFRGECRLLTLTGLGGSGKSRIATALARRFLERSDTEVRYLDLAAPAGAAGRLKSLIEEAAIVGSRRRLRLVVLDNVEDVAAAAGVASGLLERNPSLKVLCSSRETLGLRSEWVYHVGGLRTSRGQDETGEACELLRDCLRRFRPLEGLTATEEDAIREICGLAEGLPLAIELAASWARALPLGEIAQQMAEDIFRLAVDIRDIPPRHRSLLAAFDPSWERLDENGRAALAGLCGLPDDFGFEEAKGAAGADPTVIFSLVARALVTSKGDGRFGLAPLLRRYVERKSFLSLTA